MSIKFIQLAGGLHIPTEQLTHHKSAKNKKLLVQSYIVSVKTSYQYSEIFILYYILMATEPQASRGGVSQGVGEKTA